MDLFVLSKPDTVRDWRRLFAVAQPGTGAIVSQEVVAQQCAPVKVPADEVEQVLRELNVAYPGEWRQELAPGPCPRCGRNIWADDLDFIYPENRERSSWRAGCNEHDFGCGFEVTAPTKNDVIKAWNAAARSEAST